MSERTLLDLPAVGYHRLHPDPGIEFQANRFLQWLGPDVLDELRAILREVHGHRDWTEAFLRAADGARADGRPLAGAYYDRAAEFFLPPGDPRRHAARTRFVTALRAHYDRSPVLVRYDNGALPAYDLAVPGLPDAPVVVVTGGFDEYAEEPFPLLSAITAAGYRVIVFDGPGQGGALEEYGLPMTPAWERPVAAVLDHFGLTDVTLVGISLGGGLAVRAAAFEPRIRRVVAFDVLDDLLDCVARQARPGAGPALRLLLALRARPVLNAVARAVAAGSPMAAWGLRQGCHVTGAADPYGFFRAARALSTRTVSGRVTADVLLLAGAADHYVPARQLHRQATALRNARSVTTRLFTAAEQAQQHCQIGNAGAALRVVLSWLNSLQPGR